MRKALLAHCDVPGTYMNFLKGTNVVIVEWHKYCTTLLPSIIVQTVYLCVGVIKPAYWSAHLCGGRKRASILEYSYSSAHHWFLYP